jgi:hypothetical protein
VLAAREAEPVSRTRYAQVLAEVDAAPRAPFAGGAAGPGQGAGAAHGRQQIVAGYPTG